MQTFEAIFSLLVFLVISSYLLTTLESPRISDSLYRVQLANDAWRVLYLKGLFKNFNSSLGLQRDTLELEVVSLGSQTGLCYFISGIQITNCRDAQKHEIAVSIKRTIAIDGKPKQVDFSVGT